MFKEQTLIGKLINQSHTKSDKIKTNIHFKNIKNPKHIDGRYTCKLNPQNNKRDLRTKQYPVFDCI